MHVRHYRLTCRVISCYEKIWEILRKRRWRNWFPSPPLGLVESVRTKGCAGSFYLVLVVLLRCIEFHFFPSEACPRNVCTGCYFQIALGICLIRMQREGNIRRKGFTCNRFTLTFVITEPNKQKRIMVVRFLCCFSFTNRGFISSFQDRFPHQRSAFHYLLMTG